MPLSLRRNIFRAQNYFVSHCLLNSGDRRAGNKWRDRHEDVCPCQIGRVVCRHYRKLCYDKTKTVSM